jgi:hypothetical protein
LTGSLAGSTIRGMRSSESGQRDGGDPGALSSVVPVGPVVPVRAPRTLPRVVIVAVLVGTAAFVAGLQLGAVRPAESPPSPTAVASVGVVSSSAPAPSTGSSPAPTPAGPPYGSEFATSFEPPGLFAQFVGGKGCVSHNEQTQQAIGITEYILVRSWTTFCPLKASSRVAFVKDLVLALSEQVPTSHWSESSDDVDSTLALFPYEDSGFIGTVTLSADAAGSGFEIVISLQERRAP